MGGSFPFRFFSLTPQYTSPPRVIPNINRSDHHRALPFPPFSVEQRGPRYCEGKRCRPCAALGRQWLLAVWASLSSLEAGWC